MRLLECVGESHGSLCPVRSLICGASRGITAGSAVSGGGILTAFWVFEIVVGFNGRGVKTDTSDADGDAAASAAAAAAAAAVAAGSAGPAGTSAPCGREVLSADAAASAFSSGTAVSAVTAVSADTEMDFIASDLWIGLQLGDPDAESAAAGTAGTAAIPAASTSAAATAAAADITEQVAN